jgi:hypothetical protein
MGKNQDPESRILDKHPGSATLLMTYPVAKENRKVSQHSLPRVLEESLHDYGTCFEKPTCPAFYTTLIGTIIILLYYYYYYFFGTLLFIL